MIGGIGWGQLLIVLIIVILIFGTKKLRNMGGDLGAAVKNFKDSVKDGESSADGAERLPGEPSEAEQANEALDAKFEGEDKSPLHPRPERGPRPVDPAKTGVDDDARP